MSIVVSTLPFTTSSLETVLFWTGRRWLLFALKEPGNVEGLNRVPWYDVTHPEWEDVEDVVTLALRVKEDDGYYYVSSMEASYHGHSYVMINAQDCLRKTEPKGYHMSVFGHSVIHGDSADDLVRRCQTHFGDQTMIRVASVARDVSARWRSARRFAKARHTAIQAEIQNWPERFDEYKLKLRNMELYGARNDAYRSEVAVALLAHYRPHKD